MPTCRTETAHVPFESERRCMALLSWLVEQRRTLDNLRSELHGHNVLGKALGEGRAKVLRARLADAMEALQDAANECVSNVRPSPDYYMLGLDG